MKSFSGKEIRLLRLSMGWSLGELARRLNVSLDEAELLEQDQWALPTEKYRFLAILKKHAVQVNMELKMISLGDQDLIEQDLAQITREDLLKKINFD